MTTVVSMFLILGRKEELGKANWTVSELIIVHLIFTAILMYGCKDQYGKIERCKDRVWKAIS